MHGRGKSDPVVVAAKPANKAEQSAAELGEPRAGTEGNAGQQSTCRAQSRVSVSQALERIRQVARERKEEKFTALFHHLTIDLLAEAFDALKEDAAAGVDGQTWRGYDANLEHNLEDLHARVQRGAYRALPSRRVYIPKADGRQRPLAIAALEDKIVQRATAAVLNAIYEEDFLGFSYGFRPGRGAHDALDALVVGIHSRKVNWIVDADIRSFFDTVDQEWLIRFVEHRIGDPRIIRLIRKWLKVGVLEEGVVTVSEQGTGQGAVISPLLANIYLHYGLDLWAERWRRREVTGDMIIVRYADDFIVGFEHEAEARRFLEAMRVRLGKFSLSLHPDKTRLIEFGRFAAANRERRGLGKPETFNFLGFTFICGKSRRGKFLIKRKTRRDRLRVKLKAVKAQLRRRMHQPIPEIGKWLQRVVVGYFNYHAVPTNSRALMAFRDEVLRLWHHALRRRSQRGHLTWKGMKKLADEWLPQPRILHPWPNQRFAVRHPRWEPYAGKLHVRICAGGAR
ncbi:MAG TPA: group II intron reverse transcriptase/maturase [Xanthobacteraceae bacterium]